MVCGNERPCTLYCTYIALLLLIVLMVVVLFFGWGVGKQKKKGSREEIKDSHRKSVQRPVGADIPIIHRTVPK